MKRANFIYKSNLWFIAIVAIFIASCNNARYLPEGQTLYLGSSIKLKDSSLTKMQKENLNEALTLAIRPKPNSTLLGWRFKLTMHNTIGTATQKSSWLHKTIMGLVGDEEPVVTQDVSIEQNQMLLSNILQNQGFFSPQIDVEEHTKKRKTKYLYTITTGDQKIIRNVSFPEDDTATLIHDIYNMKDSSILKSGNPYNLTDITNERLRISNNLKNMGYYFFSPDYLLARIDTGLGSNNIDVHLSMQYDLMPENVYHVYKIRDISINSNYQLTASTSSDSIRRAKRAKAEDTLQLNLDSGRHVTIIDRRKQFRPKVFYEAIKLKPGSTYSVENQNITLNRMVSLNAFKFIKNEFSLVQDSSKSRSGFRYLDVNYLLTPYPKKSFTFEVNGYSQNDSRLGSRVSVGWKTRNLFKGAEQYSIKVNSGFEVQYGGPAKTPNIYSFGIENNLIIPRSIVPSFIKYRPSSMYVPKTTFNLSYNFLTWKDWYRIHSFSMGLGYNWKETVEKEHNLFPINITFVRTDTLDNTKASEFNYSNLLFRGVIIGPTYEYTYNTQLSGRNPINNFYFDGLIDLSGNILGLAMRTSLDKDPKKILGNRFAQYIKVQADGRFYHNISKSSSINFRVFGGLGYAYGNSNQLPNIKQFFAGGASSLRGFQSRLLGPGGFNNYNSDGSIKYVQLLGDVKLETNAEYRFPIFGKYVKGALFIDAGNIWTLRKQDDFPDGNFTKDFYKQIAVSTGFGTRFDFTVIILRIDFGVPLRKPWLPDGERWVIDKIKPLNGPWRSDNIIFNLAIGYPF